MILTIAEFSGNFHSNNNEVWQTVLLNPTFLFFAEIAECDYPIVPGLVLHRMGRNYGRLLRKSQTDADGQKPEQKGAWSLFVKLLVDCDTRNYQTTGNCPART